MKEGWIGVVRVVYNLKEVVREGLIEKEIFKKSLEGEEWTIQKYGGNDGRGL